MDALIAVQLDSFGTSVIHFGQLISNQLDTERRKGFKH